jgi:tRNA-dihydrouridine synthase B
MRGSMNPISALLRSDPVVLAPMEDVSDAAFRRVARSLGARLCFTEFVRAEQMIARAELARRKATLAEGDAPTAIQIYGADAGLLVEAAVIAAEARPPFVDINCGCWLPRVARGGAGAGWLREPAAMVEMVRRVCAAVAPFGVPVTVKTRIGYGPESHMPASRMPAPRRSRSIAARRRPDTRAPPTGRGRGARARWSRCR